MVRQEQANNERNTLFRASPTRLFQLARREFFVIMKGITIKLEELTNGG
jgi:hypothetical protein